jgi:hypothetical protein
MFVEESSESEGIEICMADPKQHIDFIDLINFYFMVLNPHIPGLLSGFCQEFEIVMVLVLKKCV